MFIPMNDVYAETLAKLLKNFKNKPLYMYSFSFLLSFYCTKEFEDWWGSYYLSATNSILMAQRILYAFSFQRETGI